MTVDEMHGMLRAFKDVKDYCDQLSNIAKDKSIVTQTMNPIVDSIQIYCDSSITIVEENIDGEIERMYERLEGKKDDRQDHRDV